VDHPTDGRRGPVAGWLDPAGRALGGGEDVGKGGAEVPGGRGEGEGRVPRGKEELRGDDNWGEWENKKKRGRVDPYCAPPEGSTKG